jgi:hypothetical protein
MNNSLFHVLAKEINLQDVNNADLHEDPCHCEQAVHELCTKPTIYMVFKTRERLCPRFRQFFDKYLNL